MIAIETLREAVARLSLEDQAGFVAYVLQALPPPDFQRADDEVAQRLHELKSGGAGQLAIAAPVRYS
jgi:hypothetical protein